MFSEPDGPYEDYHDNGKLMKKATRKDGFDIGVIEYFYENGQLLRRYEIDSFGKFHNVHEKYHENGQLEFKANFKEGKILGYSWNDLNKLSKNSWTKFYANGQVAQTGNHKNGCRVGEWHEYYENGSVKSLGPYKVFNSVARKHGDWIYYYEAETPGLKHPSQYEGMKENGSYEAGLRNGTWGFYYESGLRKCAEEYEFGWKSGEIPTFTW